MRRLPCQAKGEILAVVIPRSRKLVSVATALVVVLNASTVLAAPRKPPRASATAQSSKAYDEGVALFRAGEHERALAIFKKLTSIEARRGAAFALEKLGRNEEAIAEFEAFIAGAPASLADQVKAARTRVAELSAARKGKVHVVTVPAGARIEVVGEPALKGTAPFDLELPPGKHVVRATLSGRDPAEREIEVVAAAPVQEVRLELAAAKPAYDSLGLLPPAPPRAADQEEPPSAPPPAAPDSDAARYGAPIITGVLGGLSLGAGVIFGLSALSKKSDYDDAPTEANLADAETDAALSTVGIAAGVVFSAITVVLLVTNPGDSASKDRAAAIRHNGFRVRF